MATPLADSARPMSLDDVVGQKHLVGENGVIRKIIKGGNIPNMIFYGPSSVGKTTVARIIAASSGMTLYKLNGTQAKTSDIKDIIGEVDTVSGSGGILLYLDEIQYLNKKQQQALLENIENGDITLIASTTENPYFYVYNAILSRCTVFEFKPVSPEDVSAAVKRAFEMVAHRENIQLSVDDAAVHHIAVSCGGDVRKALNAVELSVITADTVDDAVHITKDFVKTFTQKSHMKYDRDADEHYDILSAYQKSMRGSDPDAALHYLARLLEAGDLPSACRRLLVTASEDVGLAYPQAITIVKSCVDAALQLGLPEARIPLAQAVLLVATAPKSNSVILSIDAALADLRENGGLDVPAHLKDSHYSGAAKMGRGLTYEYAHDFKNHYCKQQYLPDVIKDHVYYAYGENKFEVACREYWEKIKK